VVNDRGAAPSYSYGNAADALRAGSRGGRPGTRVGTMDAVITIAEVEAVKTRTGTIRYVVKDGDGNEYTTFRESIGERAQKLDGKRARIEYHEQQRGQYTNVYLDKVEPGPPEEAGAGDDSDPEEAAWRTAVDAAPWLVGESDPSEAVPPDELYDKLKPFKERVAEDIRES
jgi:hypothetical protein